jgi:hypothetical protein
MRNSITIAFAAMSLLVGMAGCSKQDSDSSTPNTNTPSSLSFTEILVRPTNTTMTMSILFNNQVEVYCEYGQAAGSYTQSTTPAAALKDVPTVIDFQNLTPNTKYYYRTRYRAAGSKDEFLAGAEHAFQTARAKGITFTFAVEADPHLDENSDSSAYMLTLQNMATKGADFLIDLGDTFMAEKLPVKTQEAVTQRYIRYRSFFGKACTSIPLLLVEGNHEGELGWINNGTQSCLPVMTSNLRKLYYPNPTPNSFYSGNSKSENFVGLRENYYAWEWGDALFVVIDPYWNTVKKPGWGWTLGADQYEWFKRTMLSSTAKYKFVFCHNLVGGSGNDARGGTEFADLFEMGGYNTDNTWGFDTNRPGWGKPIHQIMKEAKTTIFFHGHDHFYGKQEKDGIIYQEVPQPSNRSLTNISAAEYGYVNGVFMPGRGYLSVTVSSSGVKVDYVKTFLPSETSGKNGEVYASYTLP